MTKNTPKNLVPKIPHFTEDDEGTQYAIVGYNEEYLNDKYYSDCDWWISYCESSKEAEERLAERIKSNPTVRIVTRTISAWKEKK